ncbi:hypothetical protein AB5J72_00455 [Streptomyces sp. CG1]|uniref:hypothetical protein n=1 Tax=Streptomyces sp. CG1 TaxID=1287523 RepID=UPI0034E20CC3
MILNPPGLGPGAAQQLPHWPYPQAVDEALTGRGIPPGTVRADRTYPQHGDTMYIVLVWDTSRTAGVGGLRFRWEEEKGWDYVLPGAGPSIATPPTAYRAAPGLRSAGRRRRGGGTPRT